MARTNWNGIARTVCLAVTALGAMAVYLSHSRRSLEAVVDKEMRRVCPCLQAVSVGDD